MNQKIDDSLEKKQKSTKNIDLILKFDKKTGYLIPVDWKHPFTYKKKNYIAILIGLNNRYEFERAFVDKIEYEMENVENNSREIGIGFPRNAFKDDQILEVRYTKKEDKGLVTYQIYYKIMILDDGIHGERLSKSEVKEAVYILQSQFFQEIKSLIKQYGDSFVFHSMKSILDQKAQLSKQISLVFFDDFFNQ